MTASKAAGDYSIPSDWGGEAERLGLLGEWRDPMVAALADPALLEPGFTFHAVWGRRSR